MSLLQAVSNPRVKIFLHVHIALSWYILTGQLMNCSAVNWSYLLLIQFESQDSSIIFCMLVSINLQRLRVNLFPTVLGKRLKIEYKLLKKLEFLLFDFCYSLDFLLFEFPDITLFHEYLIKVVNGYSHFTVDAVDVYIAALPIHPSITRIAIPLLNCS